MDMEVVQRFNAALSSLYEVRLPISKAKMTEITRISMLGVKMYKHIVQSVERFIHKCRPEYKLPALYVIDSIVRQSRHHFGQDKDVYGPRFTRNMQTTFQNLFMTCLTDDKPKIVRVLNLWQKNHVFSPEVIQPLLDLANPNALLEQVRFQPPQSGSPKNDRANSASGSNSSSNANSMISSASAAANAVISLANNLNKKDNATLIGQLQQLANSLNLLKNEEAQLNSNVMSLQSFSDVDYRNNNFDEEDNRSSTPTEAEPPYSKPQTATNTATPDLNSIAGLVQNIFNNSDFLQQINILQSNNNTNSSTSAEVLNNVAQLSQLGESMQPFLNANVAALEQIVSNSNTNSVNKSDHTSNTFTPADNNFSYNSNSSGNNFSQSSGDQQHQMFQQPQTSAQQFQQTFNEEIAPQSTQSQSTEDYSSTSSTSRLKRSRSNSNSDDRRSSRYSSRYTSDRERDRSREQEASFQDNRDHDYRNHRSRTYHDRSRSRSTSPSRTSPYSLERAKKRERRRKGYPSVRKNYLTICSTTLWIGHIPKYASESDLSDVFGEYGVINSIDLIPSRGCAFVCMDRRQDAYKAFNKLKAFPRIMGSQVKFAWAPGKGMKDKEYKDYWESDIGCSFIPYSVLNEDVDLDALEDGGVVDDETIPENIKEAQKLKKKLKKEESVAAAVTAPQVHPNSMIPLPFAPPAPVPHQVPQIPLPVPPGAPPPPALMIHGQFAPFSGPVHHGNAAPPPPPPVLLMPGTGNSVLHRLPTPLPPPPPPTAHLPNSGASWTANFLGHGGGDVDNQAGNSKANTSNESMTNLDMDSNDGDAMSNGPDGHHNNSNQNGLNSKGGHPMPDLNMSQFVPLPPNMAHPPHPPHSSHLPILPVISNPPVYSGEHRPNERSISPPMMFDRRPPMPHPIDGMHDNDDAFDNYARVNNFDQNGTINNHQNSMPLLNNNRPNMPGHGLHPGPPPPPPQVPQSSMGILPPPPDRFFEDPFAPSLYELKNMERNQMIGDNGPIPNQGNGVPSPHFPMQPNTPHHAAFTDVRFHRPPLLQNPSFMPPANNPIRGGSRFWQSRRNSPNNYRRKPGGGPGGPPNIHPRSSRWQPQHQQHMSPMDYGKNVNKHSNNYNNGDMKRTYSNHNNNFVGNSGQAPESNTYCDISSMPTNTPSTDVACDYSDSSYQSNNNSTSNSNNNNSHDNGDDYDNEPQSLGHSVSNSSASDDNKHHHTNVHSNDDYNSTSEDNVRCDRPVLDGYDQSGASIMANDEMDRTTSCAQSNDNTSITTAITKVVVESAGSD